VGALPPEWSVFESLQQLALNENGLTGSLPPQWSTLNSIQALNLRDTTVVAPLPKEWSELANTLSDDKLELTGIPNFSTSTTGLVPSSWNQSPMDSKWVMDA